MKLHCINTFTNRLLALSVIAMVCFQVGFSPVAAQNRPIDRAERQRAEVLGGDDIDSRSGELQIEDEGADESSGDATPLGIQFRAIHLISHQSKASMSPEVGKDKVRIDESLPAPIGLEEVILPYIGEEVSMARLGELGKDIVKAWRASDYPLVDVYFPEQNVTLGKIQIVVREAVLGKKTEEGAVHSRSDYLLDQVRVNSGDRVNRRVVQADLDWLNENPIRQVNIIYERGESDGTSDIIIDVNEEKQLTAYTGFANTGVNFTGEEEWSFGVNLANPWNTEQSIGYHYTTDLDWDSLSAHSVFYQNFLPWRHTLSLIGAYVNSEANNAGLIGVQGESKQLSAEYKIPLDRPHWNNSWKHSFTAAFDYKTTNTDLFFGGLNVFASDVAVGQFRAEYEATFPDEFGFNRFAIGVVGAPGDLFGNNDDTSFLLARAGSESSYFYSFAEAEKLIRLPQDWSLRLNGTAQATEDRLTSTEQLLGGGYATVRGYDESLIRADSGLIVNVELISPEFSLLNCFDLECDDQWNAFAFYDGAAFDISDPLPGEVNPSLQSVGLGLNCQLGDHGFARAAYGWAVDSHGVNPALIEDGKFHFGVTLLY